MTKKNKSARSVGAVLVFALLILVTATLVIGGLAQLAATQSLVGGREWEEARQRVTMANSRAMARQFLLERIFSNRADGPLTNPPNINFASSGRGEFRLSELVVRTSVGVDYDFWSSYLTTSSVTGLSLNPFNLLERGGFYPGLFRGAVLDGSTNTNGVPWNFQVRTRNPIAAGYSLVWHSPNSVNVNSPSNRMVFLNETAGSPETVVGLFAQLPLMPLISVTNAGASYTNGRFGEFDVPTRAISTNFPAANISFLTNSNSATMQVVLSNITSSPATNLCLDIANTNADGLPIVKLLLVGETNAANTDPSVSIRAGAWNTHLQEVQFTNNANTRRVYLSIRQLQKTEISFLWPSGGDWRMAVSISWTNTAYPRVNFASVPIAVRGGIRTDAEIQNNLSGVTLISETNPGSLDFIGDQMMWLEDYRAQ